MKGVRYPAAQRLAYVRLLNGLLEQLTHDPSWYSQDPRVLEDKLAQLVGSTRVAWVLGDIAKKIESITQEDFQKQLAPVLGVTALAIPTADELRKLFVQQNMKLIKSLSENHLNQVEQIVLTGLRQGSHVRDLERIIRNQLGVTKQQAQLIARDQVSKYSGDLTKHNQTYVGITHYRWETSRDERVRPEHKALDGKIFAWDSPPVSHRSGDRFHPRQGYRCRCDAIPVID
ncbi:MAG: phage minor head protein [Myxococcaceae bacterium]